MKILKLLNRNFFLIISLLFFTFTSLAEDKPIDIWNVENNDKKTEKNNPEIINEEISSSEIKTEQDIFNMQKKTNNQIKLDADILSKEIEILGLYDPEDNSLDIDMWTNSDGDQLKNIFKKINRIDLSNDASEIMKIVLLTNAYPPKKIY